MYKVEYTDRKKFALSANLIAENIFVQIYEEGNRHVLMDEITDHRFDEAVVKSQDAFVTITSGTKRTRQTTQRGSICIKWRDRNTLWVALKETKEAYPAQLADYAVAAKFSTEPTFALWVPHNLKMRNRIIEKVKSKYWLC